MSLSLDLLLMFLSRQMGFTVANTPVVCAVQASISGFKLSRETIAPKYFKYVTISSICGVTTDLGTESSV